MIKDVKMLTISMPDARWALIMKAQKMIVDAIDSNEPDNTEGVTITFSKEEIELIRKVFE